MKSEVGLSAKYPRADLHNPQQFKQVMQNIANVYHATPEKVRQAARPWYHQVHEAVAKGVKGTSLSHWQGSGLVAAVSPSMDFEKNNIGAFQEMHHIKPHEWSVLERSAAAQQRSSSNPNPTKGRSPEAEAILKGTSLSRAPDKQLAKASHIMQGGDPGDVLPLHTSPKTHSFASNIHDPTGQHCPVCGDARHAAIDGRAHDIAMNRMTPWTFSGRGIDSAGRKNPTRYDHFVDAYHQTAHMLGEEHTPGLQAITWVGGQHIEKAAPTVSGRPRVKGVTRVGQPYVP